MYKCENCQESSKEKQKLNRIYSFRDKVYENERIEFDHKTKRKKRITFTTTGKEISGELKICKHCLGE